jgi:uncharacterized OB-fold protein
MSPAATPEEQRPALLRDAPAEAREFFEHCARGELAVQRCGACALLRHFPRPHCPRCLSSDYTWLVCSGAGVVHAFTVIRQNANPRFARRLPYCVAYVELAEGVRLLSGLRDVDVDAVHVGLPVQVVFIDEPDALPVPWFRPR